MPRFSLFVATALLVASLTPVASIAAESSGPPPPTTIQVVARATVAVKPDQGEVQLGVTTDAKTASAAVGENQKKMEQVMAVMKKEVGAGGEVRTAHLNVMPRFEEPRPGQPTPRIVGYTVTNVVQARVANTGAVGRLLDLAFQAGANTVERVAFTLKDPEAAQNQALRAASAKARARATAIAEGQGLKVGEVLSVSEGEREGPPWPLGGGFDKRASLAATPIEPGSVEVTAAVTVIFALKTR